MKIREILTLGYNKRGQGHVTNPAYGQITVSVVFRPVASIEKSGKRELYPNRICCKPIITYAGLFRINGAFKSTELLEMVILIVDPKHKQIIYFDLKNEIKMNFVITQGLFDVCMLKNEIDFCDKKSLSVFIGMRHMARKWNAVRVSDHL